MVGKTATTMVGETTAPTIGGNDNVNGWAKNDADDRANGVDTGWANGVDNGWPNGDDNRWGGAAATEGQRHDGATGNGSLRLRHTSRPSLPPLPPLWVAVAPAATAPPEG